MNRKKKYKCLIIVAIIIILICIFFTIKSQANQKMQDDIIFFKFFGKNGINTNEKSKYANEDASNNNEIVFDILNKETQEKSIDFFKVTSNEFKEKLAPGTSGNFVIKIRTNKDIKYKVYFKSENQKPKNLVFNIANDNDNYYDNLENISDKLIGNLNKNGESNIQINWRWEYYKNSKEDLQDTEDGKEIKQYKFRIIVKAE